MTLEEKIKCQREARALSAEVAPGVPFVFIVDQMFKRVYLHEGRPCLKYTSQRGAWSLVPYDYLAHPRCAELRRLVKQGWTGL